MEQLQARIRKMVGKVVNPQMKTRCHPLIRKLLDQDEERRKEYKKNPRSWNEPKFDAPIEKRRLRILNALFLSTGALGCQSSISTSKYDYDKRDASIKVGDQFVTFTLKPLETKRSRKNTQHHSKPRLCLRMNAREPNTDHGYWEDTETSRIEKQLTEIVNKIILTGEIHHRNNLQYSYEWKCERRDELIKLEQRRKLEAEQKVRELKEKQERERIERLLNEATALQHANTIRRYVKSILGNASTIPASQDAIETWANWALAQADCIDPIKNLSFLSDQTMEE